jgi:hypothetical protein
MTAGEIRFELAESIQACIVTHTISRAYYLQCGPYLDNGRNNLCRVFNDPQVRDACTHLLMVDSDIAFHPDDVRLLYAEAEDKGVVGGVYYSNYGGVAKPVVYDWTTNEIGLKTLEVIDRWDDGWPFWPTRHAGRGPDPMVKVPAMGAGFLMIRYEVLDVLEALHGEPQPWFEEPVRDGVHFGEDLAFCLRAADAGFSVWAHRGVEVAHIKPAQMGPQPGSRVNTDLGMKVVDP